MILQDTAQVNTVYKQTFSYTQSVFPSRYFPLGSALVQECNAFLGLIKNPACSIYGHLENLTLPIKSTQLTPAFLSPKQQQPPLWSNQVFSLTRPHTLWSMEVKLVLFRDYSHIEVNVPRTPGLVRATTPSPVGLPGAGIMSKCPKPTSFLGGADTSQKTWI